MEKQNKKTHILTNNIIIIVCTIPNNNEFTPISIAKTLIANKLAACVNILANIYSVYHWNDDIQEQEETQLIIKTCEALEESVFKEIKTKHPYQIPELLTFKITHGENNYLSWIYNSLKLKT